MKTNYLKTGITLIAAILLATAVEAQTSVQEKSATDADRYENYNAATTRDGKKIQKIQTNWHDHFYRIELVDGKLTSLDVDGEKIPASGWAKYETVIAEIKKQIKEDEAQAKRDQAQARLDQQQAVRDQIEAKKDQEEAARDQEDAKRDQAQAKLDQDEAKKDQEGAVHDQEEARRDQAQAKLDQIQAKKDQAQAAEDQRLMKQMLADLVSDKIAPNENGIHEITLDADGMTVNGVKQPDSVYQKYKTKYSRFAAGNFSYGNDTNSYHGIHMGRQK